MKPILRVFAFLTLAVNFSSAQGGWIGLGPASGYNEFVLGDSTRSNSDTQGRVAVGGNLTLTSMSIATQVSSGNNLLVGGNLTQTYGSVNGAAEIAGKATLTGTAAGATYHVDNLAGSSTNNGASIIANSGLSPTFFSDAAASLKAESTYLGGLAATATPLIQYGALNFNAGSSSLAIFHVTASQLATANSGLNFNSNVANTTFVIDVDKDGTAFSIPNTGTSFGGTNPSDVGHVLYNFYDTPSGNNTITLSSVRGSVLAAFAHVDFNSGGFNGQLIAGSLTGTGESHTYDFGNVGGTPTAFTGTLPTPSAALPAAVPEPGSIVLLGLGAIVVFCARRRIA
ncbi:MAG: collagen-binding domain-containing protein [Schlesneria sp.]